MYQSFIYFGKKKVGAFTVEHQDCKQTTAHNIEKGHDGSLSSEFYHGSPHLNYYKHYMKTQLYCYLFKLIKKTANVSKLKYVKMNVIYSSGS